MKNDNSKSELKLIKQRKIHFEIETLLFLYFYHLQLLIKNYYYHYYCEYTIDGHTTYHVKYGLRFKVLIILVFLGIQQADTSPPGTDSIIATTPKEKGNVNTSH